MNHTNLTKVVIPVAGLGTRLLPATKAIPKEMLPIVDKPIIQYVIEECILAGFKNFIFVTHSSKNSIENHFDKSFELETTLEKRIKKSLLNEIRSISDLDINITSVRQSEAKGLGHAVLQAEKIIDGDPFALVLPDRVMNQKKSNLKSSNLAKMRKDFLKTGFSDILLEKVPKKKVSLYGIASLDDNKKIKEKGLIRDIIEKPSPQKAPSNMAVVGRYIFTSEIFQFIAPTTKKIDKEIEITEAIRKYIRSGRKINATLLEGECFDCGSKEGYFEAFFETALYHKETRRKALKIISSFKK